MVSKAIRNFTLPSQEQKPNGNKLETGEGQQEFEAGEGEQVCQVFMSDRPDQAETSIQARPFRRTKLGARRGGENAYVRTLRENTVGSNLTAASKAIVSVSVVLERGLLLSPPSKTSSRKQTSPPIQLFGLFN
ncbi:unnamed protein product [Prunus armeniaca]